MHLFQALTGTRGGEAFCTRWSSLEEKHGVPVVQITQSLAICGAQGFATAKKTKTKGSKRPIPLHTVLVAALEDWKATGWQAYVGRPPKDDASHLSRCRRQAPAPARGSAPPREATISRPPGYPRSTRARTSIRRDVPPLFSTWLETHGVPGEHIDWLLGHSQTTTRGKHYSGASPALLAALKAAVDEIQLDLEHEARQVSTPSRAPPIVR